MKVKDQLVSPPAQPWDVDCQAAGDGLTKQEFVKDCDVNEILRRCLRTGVPVPGMEVQLAFADAVGVGDFADCVRRVDEAKEAFMTLPAEVRTEFDNDPSVLVAFLADGSNRDRAIELGLVAKPPVAPPAPEPAKPA